MFLEFYLRNSRGICLEYFDDKFGPGFNCASFIQFQNHFMHSSKKCLKIVFDEIVQLWECNRNNVEIMENSGINILKKEKHISMKGIFASAKQFPKTGTVKIYKHSPHFGLRKQWKGKCDLDYLDHDSKEELRKICQNTSFF